MQSARKDSLGESNPHLIEWQVCEDERNWQLAKEHPFESPMPGSQVHSWMAQWAQRWVAPSLLILLVLAGLGGRWLWDRSQKGLDAIETELQTAVDAESWLAQTPVDQKRNIRDEWQVQIIQEAGTLHNVAESGELINETQVVDLGQDWAVLQLVIHIAGRTEAYRQTRVYQKTSSGWVRVAPSATRWGRSHQLSHQLETRHFVFHYFTQDAAAVEDAADRLDRLYVALYSAFFPEPPGNEKLVVEIDPARVPGQMSQQTRLQDALVLASPAATLTPVELAATDLLAQSLMLALFDKLADQATQRYNLPTQWVALRNGLRYWLIWNQELPLAIWREPLVKWVLWHSPPTVEQEFPSKPAFARDLCTHHHLWMQTPLEAGVPIGCWHAGSEEKIIALQYPYPPPLKLPLPWVVDVPVHIPDVSMWPLGLSPAAAVTSATMIEYAAMTFGMDRLPILLAAFPEGENWETLIPAVYGVSLTEFESGWRVFIAERYGITR